MSIGVHPTPTPTEASLESVRVLQELLSEYSHGLVGDYVKAAQLARDTARRLGLGESSVARVELGARLHDIGKVAIPDAILQKSERLNKQEWAVICTHTEIGERIIGAAPSLADVATLVRSHHERYDGSGYPDGLAGEEIPLGSRIIAVCDAFLAMMRKRTYIDAITVVESLAELERCSGTQFDPDVVEAFREVFNELFS